MDGDSEGDVCDSDRDGDGQLNTSDPCPDDATNACVPPPPPPPPSGADVMAADDFVGGVGFNTHFTFPWSNYNENYVALTQLMKDANIRHVRDNLFYEPGTGTDAERYMILRHLAANGIGVSCVADDGFVGMNPITVTKINYVNTQSNNACTYFEGRNEPDLRSGWTVSNVVASQQNLFNAVNGSTRPDAPVAIPSITQKVNAQAFGTSLNPYADKGNMHPYFWREHPSMDSADMRARLDAQRAMTPGKPLIATEFGWSVETTDGGIFKVNPNVQSKYLLRALFWGLFEADFERVYFYEFLDEPGEGTEANFGIVRSDLSPKPAYTSLKRLNALLAEPNAPIFTPQPLGYTLSGAPADVKAHTLQKSSGTHYLVLYRNLSTWNTSTNTEIQNPSASVTVNLSSPASRIVVHSPHTSATPISSTAGPLSSVNVSVPDHPVVVEVQH
jgi:hypothetical protein